MYRETDMEIALIELERVKVKVVAVGANFKVWRLSHALVSDKMCRGVYSVLRVLRLRWILCQRMSS